MRIAMLSPLSWRTPPRHYGPWENVVSLLTEQLVAKGVEVTLFATGDSLTSSRLSWVCQHAYSEDPDIDPKVWECLHISQLFEQAEEFDLIHNHYDFVPLSFSHFTDVPILTTIHGFSSPGILPVYKKYNNRINYVAVSNADRHAELDYIATIHHGIDLEQFPFQQNTGDYLLFFARIHPQKGLHHAIEVARQAGKQLLIAGIIQDETYFRDVIRPHINGTSIKYLGSVGPEQRSQLLGGALALLHLIDYDESFALSVIEAQACGTPVIAFNHGSVSELIRHGRTGFIVDNPQQVIEAIGQLSTIERQHCRQMVEIHFTSERMALDYLDIYKKILTNRENYRPWGHYQNLYETGDHKVKELIVKPGGRLSLQKHQHRAEHWMVISGEALVTLNGNELMLRPGMSVDIARGATHRISNQGKVPVVLVEIQLGDYFGEDDIIRLEDDYNRNQ